MGPTTGPPSATAPPLRPRRPAPPPPGPPRPDRDDECCRRRGPGPHRQPCGALPVRRALDRPGGADAEEPQLRGCRDEGGRTLGRDGAPPAGEADEQKSAEDGAGQGAGSEPAREPAPREAAPG